MFLTFVTAQVSGAPRVFALEGVSAVHGSVVVRARVVRAERFTTLLFLALVVFAFRAVSVLDRSITVRTVDGVAVLRVGVVGLVICIRPNGQSK